MEIVKIHFFHYETLSFATVGPFFYKVTSGMQVVLHGLGLIIIAVFFGNVTSAVPEGLQLLYHLSQEVSE